MTVKISNKMRNWIAQSGSLNSFYDFQISSDEIAKYTILKSYDDFYISLYCSALESLRSIEDVERADLLSLAKGFELFARKNISDFFIGINSYDSITLAAVLKYIAGYSSSSKLLIEGTKGLEPDSENHHISELIFLFLSKEIKTTNNAHVKQLETFLKTGDLGILESLSETLRIEIIHSLDEGPIDYFMSVASKAIIEHFRANNIWKTLLAVSDSTEFWSALVSANVQKGIWDFFPSQRKAIEKGVLNLDDSFALQMPTSSGKTSLCEAIIYYHIKTTDNPKVIFLAPFRALASELKQSMGKRLKPYGIRVKALYGGSVPSNDEQESIDGADLIIATPEKMMAIEDVMPDLLKNITLVICDEGHLLDDSSRGFDYELFLTRLKVIRGREARFIYLSAIVPNLADINAWLGGNNQTSISSEYRPTSIDIAYLVEQGSSKYKLDVNPHKKQPERYDLYNFLTKQKYQYRNPKTKRINTYPVKSLTQKTVACALKSLPVGATAIFSPTKNKKSGVPAICQEILKQIKLIEEHSLDIKQPSEFAKTNYINNLAEYFKEVFSQDYLLVKCIENGFAYHHGSLPQYIREIIEESIRHDKIQLVVCTNTLAEGVNLPLRVLIINSTSRYYNEAFLSG